MIFSYQAYLRFLVELVITTEHTLLATLCMENGGYSKAFQYTWDCKKHKKTTSVHFSSVNHWCRTLKTHVLQHARTPYPSPAPRVYSNLCPRVDDAIQPSHPTISSSVILFSSHLQSFPASGSLQMSHFFASGGQSTGVSASASVLPMNIQDWFPLGWTGWISLQSKGLSRVFFNIIVQKYQFFSAQLSL